MADPDVKTVLPPRSNIVGLYYEAYNPDVQIQILRDLIALSAEFGPDFSVNDRGGMVPKEMLEDLHLRTDNSPPDLAIRYKVGDTWPKVPTGIEIVDRNLTPDVSRIVLEQDAGDPNYLKPQGREGANLTERYLNRTYPRGKGIVDPIVMLLWT